MASVTMLDVCLYVAAVLALVLYVFVVTEVGLGVMYARAYYRQHPELEPPNRRFVRLCLRGVR